MDVAAFLRDLQALPGYGGQIAHVQSIPEREPAYGELREPLSAPLSSALRRAGIESLYSHQAEAVDAVRDGHNVIVSTPSASGKSLCYHLPVLDALTRDRSARALLLFPTKALARDQSRGIAELAPSGGRIRHDVFDGDTPVQERARIRRGSRLVITNPDMLHRGILPNHQAWYELLRRLRFVVVDEAHVVPGRLRLARRQRPAEAAPSVHRGSAPTLSSSCAPPRWRTPASTPNAWLACRSGS